jgi:hypothetical protein
MAENKKQPSFEITPAGSLGLLALGAVGLRKWREVRDAHRANNKKEDSKEKEDGQTNS